MIRSYLGLASYLDVAILYIIGRFASEPAECDCGTNGELWNRRINLDDEVAFVIMICEEVLT